MLKFLSIQMPRCVRLRPALTQIHCNHQLEMIHLAPNCLIGGSDASFLQQVLDVTKAQSESDIQRDHLLNDQERITVSGIADFEVEDYGRRSSSASTERDNVGTPSWKGDAGNLGSPVLLEVMALTLTGIVAIRAIASLFVWAMGSHHTIFLPEVFL